MILRIETVADKARRIGFAIVLSFLAVMTFLAFIGTFCKPTWAEEIFIVGKMHEPESPTKVCREEVAAMVVLAAAKETGTSYHALQSFFTSGLCFQINASVIIDEIIDSFEDYKIYSRYKILTLVRLRALREDGKWEEFWGFIRAPVVKGERA